MTRWRLSPRAQSDLDEIWNYIARQGDFIAADRFVERIYSKIALLSGTPLIGTARPEISADTRSFPVGNYLVYYRVPRRGGIRVSHIVHGARDQRAALEN